MYRIEKRREERLRRNREYMRHQKVAIIEHSAYEYTYCIPYTTKHSTGKTFRHWNRK